MDMFTTKTNIEIVIPRENGSLANNDNEVMEFTINVIACTSIGCSLDCKSIPYIYQGMSFTYPQGGCVPSTVEQYHSVL